MGKIAAAAALMSLLAGCSHVVPGTPAAAGLTYVVFFQEWSAGLDDAARKSIAAAAASAKDHPSVPILVSGYAANDTGSNAANKSLARTRAQVVADTLREDGVSGGRIKGKSLGATDYALDPLESRRVEISVGES